MSIRILHLGTELSWRGGENQARLLIDGLNGRVEAQFAASPKQSLAYKEKKWSCEILPLHSGSPNDLFSLFDLVKFIKKNDINIIDAHTAKAHSLALRICSFLPHVKLVVHRRVDNVPKSFYFTRKKYFSPKVNQFVAISHSIKSVLMDYGIPNERITVVRSAVSGDAYNGINRALCQENLKIKYQIPKENILIGNASALSTQKGHETLLRAAAELRKITDKFSILIAGDGDQKSKLEQLRQELNLQDTVIFTGFLNNVPEFLSGLEVLAVPSNNEGLGTVILDGILAGCVVVASRVGGIPEIIVHHKTGLLQEVGDFKSLANNLADIIKNPVQAQILSKNAQSWVEQEFSLKSMIEGNLAVYSRLLGK